METGTEACGHLQEVKERGPDGCPSGDIWSGEEMGLKDESRVFVCGCVTVVMVMAHGAEEAAGHHTWAHT